MSVEVVMPRLSDSMEEGTILKWLKADGDAIERGEPLAEIETDKATLTYESDASGVLTIVAAAGETHPIGTVIARLDADGTDAAHSGSAAQAAGPEASPTTGRVKASPVARRIARELDVDLQRLAGSGPGGRIVRADVERAARDGVAAAAAPAPAPAPAAPAAPVPVPVPAVSQPGAAKGDVTVVELSRTQQLIARRMAESKATIPDFTLRREIDMEACVQLRSGLKALAAADGSQAGEAPSYNDMVIKAAGLALREFPRANGSYRDGRFELHGRVNVGVAVATADGLVVPTVLDADRKPLREIARETRALAERVRAGTVTPPELSGGTFTVSNLGMFGVSDFTAVINPPQAAILAVGELAARAVVRDGEIVARHTMVVTLACDHRILYGADAARFLARVRALLEQPLALTF